MTVRLLPRALLAAALLAGACDGGGTVTPAAVPQPVPSPGASAGEPAARPAAGTTHAASHSAAPSRAQIDAAISRGVDYLLKDQNRDGSWGSPAPTLTVDIYAPGPGSHEAYCVATSALATTALIEAAAGGASRPGIEDAIRRGADFLMRNSRTRRDSVDVLYNVWASGYSLETFAKLLATEKDAARTAALRKASADCVDMLVRYEYVEGGWGYYDFDSHTRHPANGATSFTTATCLAALRAAKDAGIDVPERLSRRAVRLIETLRKPDGAFAYSWDHRYWPQGGINKIKGSLARTPACYVALRGWGAKVTPEQVLTAFENLAREGRFLAVARKYPVPHEAWYQNSGYFCFYGYDYATRLLPVLSEADRKRHAESIAGYLVPLQEEDGSFWDYQLYTYHKPYGTGMVVSALLRCR